MIHCDVKTCVGCRMCEVACSSFHFGATSPALSRIRVAKLEHLGVDMAVACVSCLEKPCLECPSEALSVGENGGVVVNAELCDGCEVCVHACPVGAIGFFDGLPLYCDLCGGEPSCVRACPSGALSFREEHKEISLEAHMQGGGNSNQKRARYVKTHGDPIRETWTAGARVDT